MKKLITCYKRRILQIIAFAYSNPYLGNFLTGSISRKEWKNFCNPGMNCYSCPASSLSCPIGAMQAVSGSMNFSFSFYVVGFILGVGIICGRWICAFLCPFGFLQELIYKIPFFKLKHIPRVLKFCKYILLGIFVIILPLMLVNIAGIGEPAFCQYICPIGMIEGSLPLVASHPEFRDMLGVLFSWKTILTIFVIIMCLSAERFFCKTMCPLGAIYGILNKFSMYHMSYAPKKCISCDACHKICPMEVNPTISPNSIECIRCGKCVKSCPNQALKLGFKNIDVAALESSKISKINT